ncbi:MBG domain-containing protein, partial [Thermophilibacter sp.]
GGGELASSLSGADANNYTISSVAATGTITAQTINPGPDDNPDPEYLGVKISEPEDQTYNGNYQTPKVKVTDSEGKELELNADYTVDYKNNVNATPGEDNYATVIITGTGNYKGTVEKHFEINPAAAVIVVDDSSKAYEEDDPEFTGSVVLDNDERGPLFTNVETGSVDTLGNISYTRDNAETGDAGKYPEVLNASVDNLNPNYTYRVEKGDFEIVRSGGNVVTITTAADGRTKVYDGEPITIEASASKGNSKLQYSLDQQTWSEEKPSLTDVGSLTIYVKATNPNYEDSPVVSATVQVTPRTVTVTTPSGTKVYDGSALTAEGKAEGFVEGETYTFTTTGSQTEVGSSTNTYAIDWNGTAKQSNYTVAENLGTLTVTPQSINPDDPTDPDPSDPTKPVYTGAEVNYPEDKIYNSEDQTWKPTVTDPNGTVLEEGTDYTVSYSTDDRTNVTGQITVTITGKGNYAGTVTRTYQILPKPVTLTIDDQTKVAGEADPSFSSTYDEGAFYETPYWQGYFVRESGEAPGTYAVTQGTFQLVDGDGFLAANYALTVVPGTLTITAAANGKDDVTPVDDKKTDETVEVTTEAPMPKTGDATDNVAPVLLAIGGVAVVAAALEVNRRRRKEQ